MSISTKMPVISHENKIGLSKADQKRQLLIDIGTEIFTKKGFTITSLDEIVEAAGIPKGSFYYYFENKEEFAIGVIKNYGRYFSTKIHRILSQENKSPLERLKLFVSNASDGVERFEFKRGCLIGNLGQEMASIQDGFRTELLTVIRDWRSQFEVCLDQAKEAGEIATKVSSNDLAKFFWSAWEGAVLCAKLEASTQPLQIVEKLFFNELLQPIKPANKKK